MFRDSGYQRLTTSPLPWAERSARAISAAYSQQTTRGVPVQRVLFYASAILLGIIIRFLCVGSPGLDTALPPPTSAPSPSSVTSEPDLVLHIRPNIPNPYCSYSPYVLRPGLGHYVSPNENDYDEAKLRHMISGTKGYYARDYDVNLGWNNMRYIIETALLHARLLNRTLVVPSFIYARGCEVGRIDSCAAFAPMIDRARRNALVPPGETPKFSDLGWRIPIEVMLDFHVLRQHHSVITVSEYLALHGLDPSIEATDGLWHQELYANTTTGYSGPATISEVPNKEYDPPGTVRADVLPPPGPPASRELTIDEVRFLERNIPLAADEWGTIDLGTFKASLEVANITSWTSETEMVARLAYFGYVPVWTFEDTGSRWIFRKTVTEPTMRAAPRTGLRGLIDDFGARTEDVLLVRGGIHDHRRPGSLFFTSPEPRDAFASAVLHDVVHHDSVRLLADIVAQYMRDVNGGRMWMAAHWRRGDFVTYGITLESGWSAGIDRIVRRLSDGVGILRSINGTYQRPNVPGAQLDTSFQGATDVPRANGKWFIATDERSPLALQLAHEAGGLTLSSILSSSPSLRHLIGWPLLFSDVQALVEQNVMARATVVFGQARSSVMGGVMNIRAERGMDPRTVLLDSLTVD